MNRQSQNFFNELAHWPEDFLKKAHQACINPLHPAHMCTLCYAAGAAGDLQLVKRLAEIAIEAVPERATSLKERLASFIQNPSLAIPQIIDE